MSISIYNWYIVTEAQEGHLPLPRFEERVVEAEAASLPAFRFRSESAPSLALPTAFSAKTATLTPRMFLATRHTEKKRAAASKYGFSALTIPGYGRVTVED